MTDNGAFAVLFVCITVVIVLTVGTPDLLDAIMARRGGLSMRGWIGVDLDGTLAFYDGWKGAHDIGEPVPAMLFRVKKWLAEGREVRIFTARACMPEQIPPVEEWCEKHLGVRLVVTNQKDFAMVELWDDRRVQVVPNTGEPVGRAA